MKLIASEGAFYRSAYDNSSAYAEAMEQVDHYISFSRDTIKAGQQFAEEIVESVRTFCLFQRWNDALISLALHPMLTSLAVGHVDDAGGELSHATTAQGRQS